MLKLQQLVNGRVTLVVSQHSYATVPSYHQGDPSVDNSCVCGGAVLRYGDVIITIASSTKLAHKTSQPGHYQSPLGTANMPGWHHTMQMEAPIALVVISAFTCLVWVPAMAL